MVIRESLKYKSTISFIQIAAPSFGIFSAAFNFSTHVGIAFKTDKIYVFYNDLMAKTLPNKHDNVWLQNFKLFLKDNKDIKSEDYQQMGRKNSATYLHQRFNLPSAIEKQIDSLLFGTATLSFSQRLERGLLKIIQTHVLMLSLFVLIYWSYLFPLDSVSNLIVEEMVEDPKDTENAQVQFFLNYHREIVGYLILAPIGMYLLVMTYNTSTLTSAK